MKELKIEIEFSPAETVKISDNYIIQYPAQYVPSCSGNFGPKPDGEDFTFFSMGGHMQERDRDYYDIFDTYEEAYQHVQEFIKECKADFDQLWADYQKEQSYFVTDEDYYC